MAMEDLWPNDVASTKAIAPVNIVREQGLMLGKKTRNKVLGKVEKAETYGRLFSFSFVIEAPALGYSYELFTFTYGVDLYPVTVKPDDEMRSELGSEPYEIEVKSEEEFTQILKRIFSSRKARKVITALLAQMENKQDESVENSVQF